MIMMTKWQTLAVMRYHKYAWLYSSGVLPHNEGIRARPISHARAVVPRRAQPYPDRSGKAIAQLLFFYNQRFHDAIAA